MSEQFRNQREGFKERWHNLVWRSSGDAKLADRIMRKMAADEMDQRIDASVK